MMMREIFNSDKKTIKFGTNNDASWMKEDEEEEQEHSLLTSKEPFRMISEFILARFTVLKKEVTDGPTDGETLL